MWEIIRQLWRQVGGLVHRGTVVGSGDGAGAMRTVQVSYGVDDKGAAIAGRSVEVFEPYGFTSNAQPGAQAVCVNPWASAELTVCVAVSNPKGRPVCAPGESVQWDDQGQVIALRRDGVVVDAAGRPDGIKLGASATLAAARATDPVSISPELATVINALIAAAATGNPTVVPPLVGTTIGMIASGSGVTKVQ